MQDSMRLIPGNCSFAIEKEKECDCLAFLMVLMHEKRKTWVLIMAYVYRIEARISRKWISVMKQKGRRHCACQQELFPFISKEVVVGGQKKPAFPNVILGKKVRGLQLKGRNDNPASNIIKQHYFPFLSCHLPFLKIFGHFQRLANSHFLTPKPNPNPKDIQNRNCLIP